MQQYDPHSFAYILFYINYYNTCIHHSLLIYIHILHNYYVYYINLTINFTTKIIILIIYKVIFLVLY